MAFLPVHASASTTKARAGGHEFVTKKIARAAGRISRGLENELRLGNLEARRDWGYAPDSRSAARVALQSYYRSVIHFLYSVPMLRACADGCRLSSAALQNRPPAGRNRLSGSNQMLPASSKVRACSGRC